MFDFKSWSSKRAFFIGLAAIVAVSLSIIAGVFYYNFAIEDNYQKQNSVFINYDFQHQYNPPVNPENKVENSEAYRNIDIVATGTDQIGAWESARNGIKKYTAGPSLQVDWFKGAQRLSTSDALSLLTKIVPDYPRVMAEVKKTPGRDGKGKFCNENNRDYCEIPVFLAGTVQAPAKWKGFQIYQVVFSYPEEMGDGRYINTVMYDEKDNKMIYLSPDAASIPEYSYTQCMFDKVAGEEMNAPVKDACKSFNDDPNQYSYLKNTYQKWFVGFVDARRLFPSAGILVVPGTGERLSPVRLVGCDTGFVIGGCGISGINSDLGIINISFSDDELIFEHPIFGKVYFKDTCYYLARADGSVMKYELIPPFIEGKDGYTYYGNSFRLDIAWKNDEIAKKIDDSSFIIGSATFNSGGCGGFVKACDNIVSNAPWFDPANLVAIGTYEASGDSVYELKDKTDNEYYEKILAASSFSPDGYNYLDINNSKDADNSDSAYAKKMADSNQKLYAKFSEEIPAIFWKDGRGNWRVYLSTKFAPMAECGKPVIYLYPQKDTKVNVKVAPNGGLTKVEPAYPADGWSVLATPQSELTNLSDGAKYPYLFWEGKAYNMVTPDYGFVLKRADVGARMKNILGRLGLNEKETADFLEFWQAKLEVKPYVFVTFVPQREFDKMTPLTISPQPDKVIRVFMDYTPLDAPVVVREPNIFTPARSGFTVVEWGGRLR